jgi:hypothetical protein
LCDGVLIRFAGSRISGLRDMCFFLGRNSCVLDFSSLFLVSLVEDVLLCLLLLPARATTRSGCTLSLLGIDFLLIELMIDE